ncbi:hypothetical protein [Hymenobacter volaticus]|uniref:Periplasmic heavy metal sensor n=1 Tax=Hymenobacter volaticus TaxID=2932254 RepID=A0ABY4G5A6_9BACT|nr:hypothetical protein [Hymenobacter volaticus]UOQ65962.1 hypothetical protein MUN86_21000 [Hymenobacter volaticus]
MGLLFFGGCDQATAPAKKGKPYKVLKLQDPGNHVYKYMALKEQLLNIMRRNGQITPEQQRRQRIRRDSLNRLPLTPEVRDQLAQLMGFKNDLQQRYLMNQINLERNEIYKTNPSFFTKSRQAQRKWLLLSQASNGSYRGTPDYVEVE